jgi:hypothetical protein
VVFFSPNCDTRRNSCFSLSYSIPPHVNLVIDFALVTVTCRDRRYSCACRHNRNIFRALFFRFVDCGEQYSRRKRLHIRRIDCEQLTFDTEFLNSATGVRFVLRRTSTSSSSSSSSSIDSLDDLERLFASHARPLNVKPDRICNSCFFLKKKKHAHRSLRIAAERYCVCRWQGEFLADLCAIHFFFVELFARQRRLVVARESLLFVFCLNVGQQ